MWQIKSVMKCVVFNLEPDVKVSTIAACLVRVNSKFLVVYGQSPNVFSFDQQLFSHFIYRTNPVKICYLLVLKILQIDLMSVSSSLLVLVLRCSSRTEVATYTAGW